MHTTKKEDPMTWKQWKTSHLSTGERSSENVPDCTEMER